MAHGPGAKQWDTQETHDKADKRQEMSDPATHVAPETKPHTEPNCRLLDYLFGFRHRIRGHVHGCGTRLDPVHAGLTSSVHLLAYHHDLFPKSPFHMNCLGNLNGSFRYRYQTAVAV